MNKAKAISIDIKQNTETQYLLFRVLIGILIALSLVYIYLIGSITFNVLARKSLENTIRTVGSHVGELELTYLNQVNQIDKNYALSKGFVDIHQNIFAARTTPRVAIR